MILIQIGIYLKDKCHAYLLKTSDSKCNLMKKWGNIEKAN
jgi:hypothetical protein